MRYWHPLTAEAVDTLRRAGPLDEIVLAAAVSAFFVCHDAEQLEGVAARLREVRMAGPKVVHRRTVLSIIRCYIQAVVQRIGSVLRQFPDSSRIHLVFSAHGLPMSLVEKGDPYPTAD